MIFIRENYGLSPPRIKIGREEYLFCYLDILNILFLYLLYTCFMSLLSIRTLISGLLHWSSSELYMLWLLPEFASCTILIMAPVSSLVFFISIADHYHFQNAPRTLSFQNLTLIYASSPYSKTFNINVSLFNIGCIY